MIDRLEVSDFGEISFERFESHMSISYVNKNDDARYVMHARGG